MNPNEVADGGVDERLRCYQCGEVHAAARMVKTDDGRELSNYSWEYRVYSEARHILRKYRSKRTRRACLERIRDIRGDDMVRLLETEMLLQWKWRQENKK